MYYLETIAAIGFKVGSSIQIDRLIKLKEYQRSRSECSLITDLVHLLAFWRLSKLQDLQKDFKHSTIKNGVTSRKCYVLLTYVIRAVPIRAVGSACLDTYGWVAGP